jgi:hypothetical protein
MYLRDGRVIAVAPSKTAGLYQWCGFVWPWAWEIIPIPVFLDYYRRRRVS